MRHFLADKKEKEKLIIENKVDINHLSTVLRAKINSKWLVSYDSVLYIAKLKRLNKKEAVFCVIEKVEKQKKEFSIDLIIAYIKTSSIEEILFHCVPLSVNKFIFTEMKRSKFKLDISKKDRFERIVSTSLKQSKNINRPCIFWKDYKYIDYSIYDKIILCSENEEKEKLLINGEKNIAIIIGPEGGFTKEEEEFFSNLKNSCQITLGRQILRSQTAAIVATTAVLCKKGEI